MHLVRSYTIVLILALASAFTHAQQTRPTTRPQAPWPPPAGALKVIIDADVANEIDDQYAIALALGMPQRFTIEGFVAAHFGEAGGHRGIDKSIEELKRVLERAGMSDKFAIKRGADPIVYTDQPRTSDGVDFIIERALAATPEQPLWLVLLGPATDAAVALLKEPRIADRMIVFWHGRTQWPLRARNFNAFNDIKAVQVLFSSRCRLVLFDTGTYLRLTPDVVERIREIGPLGRYLVEIRSRKPHYMSPTKGLFDLGDTAALADPSVARFEVVPAAPGVDHDLRYDFTKDHGPIVRIYHVETKPTFELLEQALRRLNAASEKPR